MGCRFLLLGPIWPLARARRAAVVGAGAVGWLVLVLVCGCAMGSSRERAAGPEHLLLVLDHPRPEAPGVAERWVVVREDGATFLLHAFDVERRRTLQICGRVAGEAFAPGWTKLRSAGLLDPVEDLRLAPRVGAQPFASRFQLGILDGERRLSAHRPLDPGQTDDLVRVLKAWERELGPIRPDEFPAALRAEVTISGCELSDAAGADRGRIRP